MKPWPDPSALVLVSLALLLSAAATCVPVSAAPPASTEEIIVTARKVEEPLFQTPYSVDLINAQRIEDVSFRSIPDMFREVPGSLVQKTAHGQGSPYLRGFTGFRNLFLVDGIRLNNAVFRDGPNQYWNTVDPGSVRRVEIVKGPGSVLYGSDAIGGTVNVLTLNPTAYLAGRGLEGAASYRYSDGEDSHVTRLQFDLGLDDHNGLLLSGAIKRFGNIEAGNGIALPNTGYDEYDLDAKWESLLSNRLTLQVAHQRVHQDDVPRTHKTQDAVPYAGTEVGSELRRNLDQDRILSYARLVADDSLGFDSIRLTLYHQFQKEERDRLRSGNRQDSQGFKVDSFGTSLTGNWHTGAWGQFTAGLDYSHDDVNSHSSSNPIQGPVADDSSYDWVGIYAQNRYPLTANLQLTSGLRLGYFSADAGSIADPVTGETLSCTEDWTEPVGNLRLGWDALPDHLHLYAGISQGFRAPNLSDLTRFDSARSNEFEIPAAGLDPEKFTSYEMGGRLRGSASAWEVEVAAFYTDISNQINRVLTGNINLDGEYEVTRANLGNGEIYGAELSANYAFSEHWSAFGHAAWLDGEISSEDVLGGTPINDNPSRLMPTNYRLGVRYNRASERPWWLESEVFRVEDGDRLSFRDQLDTQRIPPGGTPDYWLWHLRGGIRLSNQLTLNLALENLLDENYRVLGSGQNEPGRNGIVTIDYTF